jgi:hypothetical protein
VAVLLLHGDHGVAELDQVFALEAEHLRADLFGLGLGGEFDDEKIGHGGIRLLVSFRLP